VSHLKNCRARCRNEEISDSLEINIENLKECNEKDVNREFSDESGDADCSCNAGEQTFNVGFKGSVSKIFEGTTYSEEATSEEITHGKSHTFKAYDVILSDNARAIRDSFRSNPEQVQSNRVAFHGTGKNELDSVLTNGFWYAGVANYGPGVYFTSTLKHAEAYVHHHMDNIGAIIEAEIFSNCCSTPTSDVIRVCDRALIFPIRVYLVEEQTRPTLSRVKAGIIKIPKWFLRA